MAKVNFNDLNANGNNRGNDRDGVKFFKLNDGEDAIVRIMLDDANDLDIRTVHKVSMEGYQYGRNVNCIMENNDVNSCPLCASGSKLDQRIYLRMVQYTVENGAVIATPVIWERSRFDKVFGSQAMATYISDYGPLSDIIVRISRRGTGLNTVYSATFGLNVMPNTRGVYRDELYPKDNTLFGTFDVLGTAIMNKNYNELSHFIQNGYFPAVNTETNNSATATAAHTPSSDFAPTYIGGAVTVDGAVPTNSDPSFTPISVVATPRVAPQWNTPNPTAGATDGGFSRPKRY